MRLAWRESARKGEWQRSGLCARIPRSSPASPCTRERSNALRSAASGGWPLDTGIAAAESSSVVAASATSLYALILCLRVRAALAGENNRVCMPSERVFASAFFLRARSRRAGVWRGSSFGRASSTRFDEARRSRALMCYARSTAHWAHTPGGSRDMRLRVQRKRESHTQSDKRPKAAASFSFCAFFFVPLLLYRFLRRAGRQRAASFRARAGPPPPATTPRERVNERLLGDREKNTPTLHGGGRTFPQGRG